MTQDFHHWTPVLESPAIDRRTGRRILFKMECHQPGGSFKIRGMSHLVQAHAASGQRHFVCSSGGNAGLAVAYCASRLAADATIFVPATTSAAVRALLTAYGATVTVVADVWDQADAAARDFAYASGAAYVSPFDDPLLWEGHSSLVDELAQQIARPDAVVLSVGGGGLLCGVLEGMHRHGWTEVPVVAAETKGAASLAEAMRAGRPVALAGITSIARSLGALQVADEAFRWTKRHPIYSAVLSDEDAIEGSLAIADHLRVLVEPACGVALAAAEQPRAPLVDAEQILVILCGGNLVGAATLSEWRGEQ